MSTPGTSEIREQLQRICESATFRSAPQVSRLLTFLIDATLEGKSLKESVVGAAFFSRLSGYDSQADPVVRTEVRRLRLKLGEYYFKEGSGAPIIIEIPSGGYNARFTMREAPPAEVSPKAAPEAPVAAAAASGTLVPPKWHAGLRLKALAAVLLVGASVWLLARLTGRPAATRRSIAVFRLTDLAGAGDTAWLGTALSQLIAADLSANSALRIIPFADVVRTRLDLGLGDDTDSLGPSELSRIRRNLDADLVIAGSYASTGPAGAREYRIDLRIYDARTGAASGAVSDTDTGDERTLFDLVSRVEARLGRQAGVEIAASQKQSPSDPGARATGLGLARSLCLQADLLPYGSAGKESLYRQSLEAGRKEGQGPWELDPLVGLAKIEAARRDFAKAADFYRQAYQLTLQYYGPDHGATAAAKIQWARAQMRTGEVREAIEQIKEAIPVARREFPPDSLRLWNILHDAVHACNDGKAFREAELYAVEALAINERLHLPPTSERWGMLYWDLGRAKRGERNYRDALAAFEKAEGDFQQFPDTRAREVQEDIEQVKAEQRGEAPPAK